MDKSEVVVFDIECYRNYFLIMFRKVSNGKVLYFEKYNDSVLDINSILGLIKKYTIVSFNGNNYDLPVIEAAVSGFSCKALYEVSKMIIEENLRPWQVRKQIGVRKIECDHIDLIDVAPLKASLKIYGGRLNCPKMQDLPIDPHSDIQEKDLENMRTYCINDLELTQILMENLEEAIDLRISMSEDYNTDVRSKSDAQIAEAVIKHELNNNYNISAKRPSISIGTEYKYKAPKNLVFNSDIMKEVFDLFKTNYFIVGKVGHIELPEALKNKKIQIGETVYKIGVGGLHSTEKSVRHISDDTTILRDYDVASYYPSIILNNRLYPKHLGSHFLEVYKTIVKKRLKAKKEGNKVIADSLKITINGSFGKFANKWSCLYSPDLMMQVTVTGQLSLLMLIERLELVGISVVSANTDGIVVKTHTDNDFDLDDIIEQWQEDTDYVLESTNYESLNNRDINNYIAVKDGGKTKGKGEFAGGSLFKNPDRPICTTAVKEFLSNGTTIEDTIKSCKDITQFIVVRTVNGGAVKGTDFLGKAIRWYYGRYELDAIYYNTNGNKVAKSDSGIPVMQLPETLPDDIDYDWYIAQSNKMLKSLGYNKK